MVSEIVHKQLLEQATIARENAFVPRSDHKVGVAILTTGEKIYAGCNVESNISGLGSCAERVAVNNAISNGNYEFSALLVLDTAQTLPCGACLQYLYEFHQISGQDIEIIAVDTNGNAKTHSLLELLPHGYKTVKHVEKILQYKKKC